MGSAVAPVTIRCRKVSWRYGLGAGNPEAGKVGQGQMEGREPSSGWSHFGSGRRCRQVWPGSDCLPQAPLPQPGQPQVIPPAVPSQALPEGLPGVMGEEVPPHTPSPNSRRPSGQFCLVERRSGLPVTSHVPFTACPLRLVWPLCSGLHLRVPSLPVFL